MKKILLILNCFLLIQIANAQNTFLKNGKVIDIATKEALPGATILVNNEFAATSNTDGAFTLNLNSNIQKINVQYLGYEPYEITLKNEDANGVLLITMQAKSSLLNQIVITGSKFEKQASEEIVSVQVIKPDFMKNGNLVTVDETVNRIPGVEVNDGQVSIRGGSGWSYGAGSRVLVLVDDMPMLAADAGDVKWDYLPIENCEQVEVIKGASSALYGSSALNGIINFRTAYAKQKPVTNISYFTQVVGNPRTDSAKWWGDMPPIAQGLNFFHSRKIKQFDLVIGGMVYTDFNRSYLQGDYSNRYRYNANIRYRFKNVPGLILGINANHQKSYGSNFFYWANDTFGMYQPYGGLNGAASTVTLYQTGKTNFDPYLVYSNNTGFKMSTRMRYFNSTNLSTNTNQSSRGQLYFFEQLFQKQFNNNLHIMAGISNTSNIVSSTMFGNHNGSNAALYAQAEKKFFEKIWLTTGWRYEVFRTDAVTGSSGNLVRAGINYQPLKATYIRASYGMGYRYPTVAEKFVTVKVGAANVLPNPVLNPEKGNSFEIGVKQGFTFKNWIGYIDLAAFQNNYYDMIEFRFDLYLPDYLKNGSAPPTDTFLKYLGFKSINVTQTSITGIDFTTALQGKINSDFQVKALLGATYINPVDLKFFDADYRIQKLNYSDTLHNVLKYRNKFTTKIDIECSYKSFIWGCTYRYLSNVTNIDQVFETVLFPVGIADYRKQHSKGTHLLDARFLYKINEVFQAGLILKNALNIEYTDRPANPQMPRNIALQLSCHF